MKTAVLYITLGRYELFFEGFYKSALKNLLPGHEKHFFVFTDSAKIKSMNRADITVIEQKKLGWPLDTLMRFEMFSKIKKELDGFDLIYFFNSNIVFVEPVREEIIPGGAHGGLMAAIFFIKQPDDYTYDRNPKSRAYIPYGQGKVYYQGGLNGGKAKDYLNMISVIREWVNEDIKNNSAAEWNDESYLNKYLLDKTPLVLQRNYLYPQEWSRKDCPGKIKIMLRDKANPVYGGVKWLRGETDKKINPAEAVLKNPVRVIKNILKRRKWWNGIY